MALNTCDERLLSDLIHEHTQHGIDARSLTPGEYTWARVPRLRRANTTALPGCGRFALFSGSIDHRTPCVILSGPFGHAVFLALQFRHRVVLALLLLHPVFLALPF